ncbi:type A2 lantipeptide [Periweissella cryptocerci]|uniref:Lantibiotic n=1 Tax=Periweissella cryptocerci TaxID=2506420 RepID=A0A4P6YU33_9LACO|nr:lacticin 481 family lantibiotic [Periweissella cryptocerci]QBO36284.1 type A2 lantipeptide [Periweissella cryptocerci]
MKMNEVALTALDEVSELELNDILGAKGKGSGVIKTLTHECKMNTYQAILTCC